MPVFRDPALGPVKKAGPTVIDLDGDGRRHALVVDGLYVFVGSYAECRARQEIRMRREVLDGDREHQDAALRRLPTVRA